MSGPVANGSPSLVRVHNLEERKLHTKSFLSANNTVTDAENKLAITGQEEVGGCGGQIDWNWCIDTALHKIIIRTYCGAQGTLLNIL